MRKPIAIVTLLAACLLCACSPGPQGQKGDQGPPGAKGLHALTEPTCGARCDLICSLGERLVSVTCPGGTVHIQQGDEANAASCVGASGPAIALCMRH